MMKEITADHELRAMIGDLFMQIAILRADLHNAKAAREQPRANGKDIEADNADHRPEPS